MSQPTVITETIIVVSPARQVSEREWRANAVIIWPDGSCDVGAAGLDGTTAQEAEKRAGDKATDRWGRIEHDQTLNKSHPAPGSVSNLKP